VVFFETGAVLPEVVNLVPKYVGDEPLISIYIISTVHLVWAWGSVVVKALRY